MMRGAFPVVATGGLCSSETEGSSRTPGLEVGPWGFPMIFTVCRGGCDLCNLSDSPLLQPQ